MIYNILYIYNIIYKNYIYNYICFLFIFSSISFRKKK